MMRKRLIAVALLALSAAVHAGSAASAAEPRIEFLDTDAARAAIVDESVEPYFRMLKPPEMTVKTGEPITGDTLEEQRAEARRRYQAGVLAFTNEEQQTLRWYLGKLHPVMSEHYPKFAALPWRFIKLSPRLEGGLPHTRGDQIVLSPPVLGLMQSLHVNAPERVALARFGNLLLHEQMHVMQRLNPELFIPLYTQVWRFERGKVTLPDAVEQRTVVNPDGVDLGWGYRIEGGDMDRYITPRLVFTQGVADPRMPHDFEMIAVEVVKSDGEFRPALAADGSAMQRPLQEEQGYLSPPLRIFSIYHPNEIAADAFAHIVVSDHILGSEPAPKEEDDLLPTRRWFAEHFSQ